MQELYELEKVLQKSGSRNPGQKKQGMALVRILEDIDTQDLQSMNLDSLIDPSWLTLPLSKEQFPALMELSRKIENLARARDRDALTGLYNRGFFQRILDREVERSFRFKLPLTLAMMDIDDFKKINDSYGHPCGDAVLRNLAETLQNEIRANDYAARIGGEEFALILPGTGRYKAEPLFWRILQKVRKMKVSCPQSQVEVGYTLSIGAATYRGRTATTAERLIADVDRQLYLVKEQGKDAVRTEIFQDAISSESLVQKDEKKFLLK